MTKRNLAGNTALVLGATGGIGGAVSRTLLARGWQVRALTRDLQRARNNPDPTLVGIDWQRGDAMSRDDVVSTAYGADLIVHAVNPPGYQRWAELVLPMLEHSIAAARSSGARIVLPGTIYNFGAAAWDDLHESAEQHPTTRKGAIRVEMEHRLKQAAEHGVRSLIVRAGDFFGPHAGNNWFSQGLIKPGKPLRSITYPGRTGIGHQWAYLPDVAETIMQLVERQDQLAPFERFHMNGHWDTDGTQMVAAIRQAVGNARLPVRSFPWWILGPAAPFVPLFREMKEMRYLWQQAIRMRNARLLSVLGSEPHTPLAQAVQTTLRGLGCLPQDQQTASPKQTAFE
jgi:nucleoside-diphosphate-sugar epimerase